MFALNLVCVVGLASAVTCASLDREDNKLSFRQADVKVGNRTHRVKKDLLNKGKECWNGGCTDGTCAFCGDGSCCRQGWTKGEGCNGANGCDGFHCCVKSHSSNLPRCRPGWLRYNWRQEFGYPREGAIKAVVEAHEKTKPKSNHEVKTKTLDAIWSRVKQYTGKTPNSITIVSPRRMWRATMADCDCVVWNGWLNLIIYDGTAVTQVMNLRRQADFNVENSTIMSQNGTALGYRQASDWGKCAGSPKPSSFAIEKVRDAYAKDNYENNSQVQGLIIKELTDAGKSVNSVVLMDMGAYKHGYYCYISIAVGYYECVAYEFENGGWKHNIIHYNYA